MDCGNSCSVSSTELKQSKELGHIDTNGLATLIASGVPFVILDARGGKWDDGKRIAHAKTLLYTATEEEAQKAIPSKQALVVVYCTNIQCPASKALADRLTELGYSNILKYEEGIQEWINFGHPVQN